MVKQQYNKMLLCVFRFSPRPIPHHPIIAAQQLQAGPPPGGVRGCGAPPAAAAPAAPAALASLGLLPASGSSDPSHDLHPSAAGCGDTGGAGSSLDPLLLPACAPPAPPAARASEGGYRGALGRLARCSWPHPRPAPARLPRRCHQNCCAVPGGGAPLVPCRRARSQRPTLAAPACGWARAGTPRRKRPARAWCTGWSSKARARSRRSFAAVNGSPWST